MEALTAPINQEILVSSSLPRENVERQQAIRAVNDIHRRTRMTKPSSYIVIISIGTVVTLLLLLIRQHEVGNSFVSVHDIITDWSAIENILVAGVAIAIPTAIDLISEIFIRRFLDRRRGIVGHTTEKADLTYPTRITEWTVRFMVVLALIIPATAILPRKFSNDIEWYFYQNVFFSIRNVLAFNAGIIIFSEAFDRSPLDFIRSLLLTVFWALAHILQLCGALNPSPNFGMLYAGLAFLYISVLAVVCVILKNLGIVFKVIRSGQGWKAVTREISLFIIFAFFLIVWIIFRVVIYFEPNGKVTGTGGIASPSVWSSFIVMVECVSLGFFSTWEARYDVTKANILVADTKLAVSQNIGSPLRVVYAGLDNLMTASILESMDDEGLKNLQKIAVACNIAMATLGDITNGDETKIGAMADFEPVSLSSSRGIGDSGWSLNAARTSTVRAAVNIAGPQNQNENVIFDGRESLERRIARDLPMGSHDAQVRDRRNTPPIGNRMSSGGSAVVVNSPLERHSAPYGHRRHSLGNDDDRANHAAILNATAQVHAGQPALPSLPTLVGERVGGPDLLRRIKIAKIIKTSNKVVGPASSNAATESSFVPLISADHANQRGPQKNFSPASPPRQVKQKQSEQGPQNLSNSSFSLPLEMIWPESKPLSIRTQLQGAVIQSNNHPHSGSIQSLRHATLLQDPVPLGVHQPAAQQEQHEGHSLRSKESRVHSEYSDGYSDVSSRVAPPGCHVVAVIGEETESRSIPSNRLLLPSRFTDNERAASPGHMSANDGPPVLVRPNFTSAATMNRDQRMMIRELPNQYPSGGASVDSDYDPYRDDDEASARSFGRDGAKTQQIIGAPAISMSRVVGLAGSAGDSYRGLARGVMGEMDEKSDDDDDDDFLNSWDTYPSVGPGEIIRLPEPSRAAAALANSMSTSANKSQTVAGVSGIGRETGAEKMHVLDASASMRVLETSTERVVEHGGYGDTHDLRQGSGREGRSVLPLIGPRMPPISISGGSNAQPPVQGSTITAAALSTIDRISRIAYTRSIVASTTAGFKSILFGSNATNNNNNDTANVPRQQGDRQVDAFSFISSHHAFSSAITVPAFDIKRIRPEPPLATAAKTSSHTQHTEFCWKLLSKLHDDLKSTLETYQLLLSSVDAIMIEENLSDLQDYLRVVQLLLSKVNASVKCVSDYVEKAKQTFFSSKRAQSDVSQSDRHSFSSWDMGDLSLASGAAAREASDSQRSSARVAPIDCPQSEWRNIR